MENICLDTNTIISYLFLSEPQHTIIKEYISKYSKLVCQYLMLGTMYII